MLQLIRMSHKILIAVASVGLTVLAFAWFGLFAGQPANVATSQPEVTNTSVTQQVSRDTDDDRDDDEDEDDDSNTGAAAASPSPTTPAPTPSTPAASGFTMAQVKTHNSASSCWSVVSGKVYDLTAWIKQHPGGQQAITGTCGIDATAAFNAQHGGQGKPETQLAKFLIGNLLK